MSKIILIGIDHTGLTDDKSDILASCQCIFAAERFHPLLKKHESQIHNISPLSISLNKISKMLEEAVTIGILASGDPMFYGVGQTLIKKFGHDAVDIHPALSSMQIAFSRIKVAWHDAHFVSLHGRSELPQSIFSHNKLFFFTDPTNTPDAIARKILQRYEKTLAEAEKVFEAYVLENIGSTEEKITHGPLSSITQKQFGTLNVMIVLKTSGFWAQPSHFGLTESDILHSRGLITKDEIRSIVLHKLQLPCSGVLWDIGAGSGSISIESARFNTGLTVFSIEKHPEQQQNISDNIDKFNLTNVHLVKGQAPEVLNNLPHPDRVFIGGSGGNLDPIIAKVSENAPLPARIVITAVTDKTRESAPQLLYERGFQVEMSEVEVTRNTFPLQSKAKRLNPITIITGKSNDR